MAPSLRSQLSKILSSPQGLRQIASMMHPVLKKRIDYHKIGRPPQVFQFVRIWEEPYQPEWSPE